MKKKGRLIFFVIMSCCFFFLVYYVTYIYTYNDLQNNKLYDESQLKPIATEEITPAIMQEKKMPVIIEDMKSKFIVTTKTTYVLEKYNETTGEFTKEILPIPIEFLGLNREKIQKYTLAKSAEEENQNRKLELVVFAENLLVLRQTYDCTEPDYMFYLVAEWGKVAVYKYYEESLYTKTNIKIIDLPADLQEKIKNGMPVENERELFRFLESYSS